MPTRVITITAQKGGVAKTTTAVNLAAALAELGKVVLLCDLDSQGNAGTHLGIDRATVEGKGVYEVFTRKIHIAAALRHRIRPNLDLLPACETLANVELEVAGWFGREKLFTQQLELVKSQYDAVIIDCPPGIGLLTANACSASDDVIVTVQPERFAVEGLNMFQHLYENVRASCNPNLALRGILLTMVDGKARGKMASHRIYSKAIRDAYAELVFKTEIRNCARIKDAQGYGRTIYEHAPKSTIAKDYMDLAKEIGYERNKAGGTGAVDAAVDAA